MIEQGEIVNADANSSPRTRTGQRTRAFERAWMIGRYSLIAVGDGDLTQELLYRPPIEGN